MKESITIGQLKQLSRILEDSVDVMGLSKTEAQKLIENGGDLKRFTQESLRSFLSSFEDFADEKIDSNFNYVSGYDPRPGLESNLADLDRELEILRSSFPELAKAEYNERFIEKIRQGSIKLPDGAERWTLIPYWRRMSSSYGEITQRVVNILKRSRHNKVEVRFNDFDSKCFRQNIKSVECLESIKEYQDHYSILVVPVQLGVLHRGCSVRRLSKLMNMKEFGLGLFDVAVLLLTHPELLRDDDDLFIKCSGDEFTPKPHRKWTHVPLFLFYKGSLILSTEWCDSCGSRYGSPSGFLV